MPIRACFSTGNQGLPVAIAAAVKPVAVEPRQYPIKHKEEVK
jgi:hypothetical protein